MGFQSSRLGEVNGLARNCRARLAISSTATKRGLLIRSQRSVSAKAIKYHGAQMASIQSAHKQIPFALGKIEEHAIFYTEKTCHSKAAMQNGGNLLLATSRRLFVLFITDVNQN